MAQPRTTDSGLVRRGNASTENSVVQSTHEENFSVQQIANLALSPVGNLWLERRGALTDANVPRYIGTFAERLQRLSKFSLFASTIEILMLSSSQIWAYNNQTC